MKYLSSMLLLLAMLAAANDVRAKELVVDLSDHTIEINIGFHGTELLVFGTTMGRGDVVLVVRGPERTETVRKKDNDIGIWINGDAMAFDLVPSYYALASSRPIDQIMTVELRKEHQIGMDAFYFQAPQDADPAKIAEFHRALVRLKQEQGLYSEDFNKISLLSNTLFRTDLTFPSNAPVGEYNVDVYLIQDEELKAVESTPITISKVGIEAQTYSFAHDHSFAYGVVAILIAVFSGWAAGVVFKKR